MSERLDIGALGAEMILRPDDAPAGSGDHLTFDVIGRPRGFVTLPHQHPHQTERFEIIGGGMVVDLAGRRHELAPGDRFEVPAGATHRQGPLGPGTGHVRVTVTPAGQTEAFVRALACLSQTGQFTRGGFPRPLAGARLVRDHAAAGRAAFPPAAVQRLLAATILRGHWLWREYAFTDQWEVAAPPGAVFAALADGRSYPRWWRPVYIDVESDDEPRVGSVSSQHFKGRLPYHLRTRSTIVRFEPDRVIEAEVDGDLEGRGIWTLTPTPAGTRVRFDWTVRADRPLLRALTPLLRPALRANHAWAIARAVEGLEPYAQGRTR